MAQKILTLSRFGGGIANSEKEGVKGSFYFAQNCDIYSDPTKVTLNPKTIKDSGTTVTNLVKWIVSGTPNDTNTYFYDLGGNIYQRTSAGAWSLLRTVAASDGQGMELFNDYLYYTQRTQLGRYGPLSGAPAFTDNWQTGLTDTTSSKFAPVKAFLAGFAVGHGNKLAWYDGAVWTLAKLTFPPGFNIRSLEIVDEFLAIGAWRGNSITASEEAYIFFWDGAATTYNFFVKSMEGAVNALLNSSNRLFSIIGSSGGMFLNYSPFTPITSFMLNKKLKFKNYMEIYPGAVTNWKNQILIGVSGATDSADIYQGIYQLDTNIQGQEALNFGYTISSGTQTGTGLSIGAVKGIGSQLFIAWKDGSTYGVDRVLQTNAPFSSGTIEFLIFDDGRPQDDKLATSLKAGFLPLLTGESIQLGYKVNRASNYTTGTADSTVGDITTKLPIDAQYQRFNEIQFEVVLNASSTTAPTLTGISLRYNDLLEEKKL